MECYRGLNPILKLLYSIELFPNQLTALVRTLLIINDKNNLDWFKQTRGELGYHSWGKHWVRLADC
jgi:hypothetical protein